jgi:hypothetical protein
VWFSINVTCFVEASPDTVPESSRPKRKFSGTNGKATTPFGSDKQYSDSKQKPIRTESKRYSEHTNGRTSVSPESGNESSSEESSYAADDSDQNDNVSSKNQAKGLHKDKTPRGKAMRPTQGSNQKVVHIATSLSFCYLFFC